MRYRPINGDPEDPRLGRFIPDDWTHVEKYPLEALAAEQRPQKIPVVIGVNWYSEFDKPEKNSAGEYFVANANSLTKIRGGHSVCLEPGGEPDTEAWWDFYDQGQEGACVGFAWSRCMSILNKELYAARWLWDRSKERDRWPETNPGDNNGTSVRAAGEVLAGAGHVDWRDQYADDDHTERDGYSAALDNGIQSFRWARSVDDVHAVLGNDKADSLGAVPFLNSWGRLGNGRGYPHRTWMPDDVLDRLMAEEGEVGVPTDQPASPGTSDPTLRSGSRGQAVERLQQALANLGFDPGSIDGIFGQRTRSAVVAFQKSRNLQADGVVGPKTWAALHAEGQ